MLHHVGDQVKIREDLNCVDPYYGETATITAVDNDGYTIDLDDGQFYWTDSMFDDKASEPEIPDMNTEEFFDDLL